MTSYPCFVSGEPLTLTKRRSSFSVLSKTKAKCWIIYLGRAACGSWYTFSVRAQAILHRLSRRLHRTATRCREDRRLHSWSSRLGSTRHPYTIVDSVCSTIIYDFCQKTKFDNEMIANNTAIQIGTDLIMQNSTNCPDNVWTIIKDMHITH